MTEAQPTPTLLKDYLPFPFTIAQVDLTFRLKPQATRVLAAIRLAPNPARPGRHDLFLHGEKLRLVSASIDGRVLPASALRITAEGLRWCIEQCIAAGSLNRLNLPSLRDDRKAIIGGGLALLYTLVTHFGIRELKPAKGALRQGVIIDLHERHAALRGAGTTDMRDHTVRELQVRFDIDTDQARRVRWLAVAWLRQAMPEADEEAVRELGWAADLHEMGLMVSHHDHHRHGAYLISNVDAPGFSQSQQQRLGDLVLAQRGGLRKVEASLQNKTFGWQTLALRLAVSKCHARGEVDLQVLNLQGDGRIAQLHYSADWAHTHPRAVHLLKEEAAVWAQQAGLRLVLPVQVH